MRKVLALVLASLAAVAALSAPAAAAKPALPSCEQKTDKKTFDCEY